VLWIFVNASGVRHAKPNFQSRISIYQLNAESQSLETKKSPINSHAINLEWCEMREVPLLIKNRSRFWKFMWECETPQAAIWCEFRFQLFEFPLWPGVYLTIHNPQSTITWWSQFGTNEMRCLPALSSKNSWSSYKLQLIYKCLRSLLKTQCSAGKVKCGRSTCRAPL